MADTPDFEYVLIDSTISKVHADATGATYGPPRRQAVCVSYSDQSAKTYPAF
jgi:hypothetical protein